MTAVLGTPREARTLAAEPDPRSDREAFLAQNRDVILDQVRWAVRKGYLSRCPEYDADDLFQEVLIRVWKYFDGYNAENPEPWLRRIVVNTALRSSARIRRYGALLDEAAIQGTTTAGRVEGVEEHQSRSAAHEALASLLPRLAGTSRAYLLALLETGAEPAEWAADTVQVRKGRRHRARAAILALMDESHDPLLEDMREALVDSWGLLS